MTSGSVPPAAQTTLRPAGLGWTAPDPVECRLETERLLIRAYVLEDAPAVYEAVRASMDHLLPWMAWAPGHTSLAFTARYVADQVLAQRAGPRFESIGVGIFERDTGAFVGGTGVHDVRADTASCETGYWLRHDRVGRGYATEACGRVISWALADRASGGLGLRRVRVFCSAANVASSRIPERLGLTPEVRQRDEVYVPGIGPTDRLGWGVLAGEWDTERHVAVRPAGG
jgi:RimJ/RimL family protein N-acetyltransferase